MSYTIEKTQDGWGVFHPFGLDREFGTFGEALEYLEELKLGRIKRW